MYGFYNDSTDTWLPDFQEPHFADIEELIAIEYGGNTDAFTLEHGAPEGWQKREADPSVYLSLTDQRTRECDALNSALHIFLASCGYDQGSQSSFLALFTDVQDVELRGDTLSPSQLALKAAIREIWGFIQGGVMAYYYQHKTLIEQSDDPASVEWDFELLRSQHPGHTLRSLTA